MSAPDLTRVQAEQEARAASGRSFVPPLPLVLPIGWKLSQRTQDGARYVNGAARMSVIVSGCVEGDGKRWLHVSVAHAERLPSWADLRFVKDVWIGRDRVALQVLPRHAEHVSIHPFCLHLWCCLDGDVTPDFTAGTGSL